jgi:peptidoglycan hydrolase-like protein with peptidoglycan-binding domain
MNSGPTLQIGSTGPAVRRLQILFVMTKLLEYTDIDGNFGPKTQDAVKSFQESSNLTADGVVGPATWNALPADPNTPRLARGSTGSVVSALQKALASYGGPNTATDPGPIDGDFGPRTESAVRVSNGPRRYSRWSRWRSDVVGPARCSRQNVGVGGRPRRGIALRECGHV